MRKTKTGNISAINYSAKLNTKNKVIKHCKSMQIKYALY